MTSLGPAGLPLWDRSRGRLLLVIVNLVFVAVVASLAINEVEPSAGELVGILVLSAFVAALQLRHSLATAQGSRPRGWRWTLLALAALAGTMVWRFGLHEATYTWFVVASAAMLLRGWVAAVGVSVPLVLSVAALMATEPLISGGAPAFVFVVVYTLSIFVIAPATLYWSARLVRTIDELFAIRIELAEVAVAAERGRVSRDLHDLLGQSLSAISLKGDLALRTLPTDDAAALAELAGLTDVARTALHDVRDVTLDRYEVSVESEVDGAEAILGTAGISVDADVELPVLARSVEELLAWTVREGTTNLLRHSDAQNCRIVAACVDGNVHLEVSNDGARSDPGRGIGLEGLADRARSLSGSVSAERVPGRWFRLLVQVPENPR